MTSALEGLIHRSASEMFSDLRQLKDLGASLMAAPQTEALAATAPKAKSGGAKKNSNRVLDCGPYGGNCNPPQGKNSGDYYV